MNIPVTVIGLLLAGAATTGPEVFTVTLEHEASGYRSRLSVSNDGLSVPVVVTTKHRYPAECTVSADGGNELRFDEFETGVFGNVSVAIGDSGPVATVSLRDARAGHPMQLPSDCGDLQIPHVQMTEGLRTVRIAPEGSTFPVGEYRVSVRPQS